MSIRRHDKRIWFLMLGIFAAVSLFTFLSGYFKTIEADVNAASLASFDPGFIISDYQMGNYTSMTEAEIQTFLTSKNPCNVKDYNRYLSLSANKNYKWHWEKDHFVCLSEEKFGDGEVIGKGDTAAHIIWQAAQDYKINPQVLIVLLQKETGLITDPIPNDGDYRKATGYGCPDTAACSSKYYGFKNQIRNAASMYRTVLDGGWTNYPLGNNYVQYNPNAACGGSVINIRSLATSALYRYTPYQPNAGALAAGYGTAACGAYGNRNFYLYFQDWFGDPTNIGEWQKMSSPRVMKTVVKTMSLNPKTGALYEELSMGTKNSFDSKLDIYWGGKMETCLRTVEDSLKKVDKCIIMSRMEETTESLYKVEAITPIKKIVDKDTYKFNLGTNEKVQTIKKTEYSVIKFSAKATMNNKVYYQTAHDVNSKEEVFIPADSLKEISFVSFKTPRNMMVVSKADFVNVLNDEKCKTIQQGYIRKFTTKVDLGGKTYFRIEDDSKENSFCAILSTSVVDAPEIKLDKVGFQNFIRPRELKLKKDVYLYDLSNGTTCETFYKKGTTKKYSTKVDYGGNTYFRDEDNTKSSTNCVVRAADLDEI